MNTPLLTCGRPAEILLVEDNDNDVELTRIGLRKAKLAINLHQVANGEECLAFLRKEGKYADVPEPDLILLDLNMPLMDGHEVLEEINRDERLRHLPIVVMTSSDAESDILSSYNLRCSSYVVKPLDFKAFQSVVEKLADYWFTLVVLPSSPNAKAEEVDASDNNKLREADNSQTSSP
jgi:CheY-like chemotaxis protein